MASQTDQAELQRLFDTGAHFAQVRSRRHPSMKKFVLGATARTEIVDLVQTEAQLEEAKKVLAALATAGKTVLFVGGKTEVAAIVKEAAKKAGQPYVAGRWLGGTISNWTEIKKRIDRLASLSEQRESGELAKRYTKLERVKIDREIAKLELRLDGITGLAKKPDALLVVDAKYEAHAVKEAKEAGIPVIAIMGSDNNLADATYPIVANDASRATVTLLLGELASSFASARAA